MYIICAVQCSVPVPYAALKKTTLTLGKVRTQHKQLCSFPVQWIYQSFKMSQMSHSGVCHVRPVVKLGEWEWEKGTL